MSDHIESSISSQNEFEAALDGEAHRRAGIIINREREAMMEAADDEDWKRMEHLVVFGWAIVRKGKPVELVRCPPYYLEPIFWFQPDAEQFWKENYTQAERDITEIRHVKYWMDIRFSEESNA